MWECEIDEQEIIIYFNLYKKIKERGLYKQRAPNLVDKNGLFFICL